MLLTNRAQAYVNHGRWIADCSRPHCGNALKLEPKQVRIHCSGEGGCNLISEVEWPRDVDEIDRALAERPVPTTRNWAPAGHRQSVAVRLPDGQSVADLIAETAHHMAT